MLDPTDAVARIEASESTDAMVSALTTSYAHATTHIAEFAKLQYQLVAIAYGLAGAAIAFFGNQLSQQGTQTPGTQLQGTFLLFLPPIFYAIAFVQIYLHTQIKRYGRYVNYDLRPKMEAVIEADLKLKKDIHLSFWNWEMVYKNDVASTRLAKVHGYIVRMLSLLIMILPVIPALAAIGLYEVISGSKAFTTIETAMRWTNVITFVITITLIGIIGWVNMADLEEQAEKRGQRDKETLLQLLKHRGKDSDLSSDEDMVADTYSQIETDPTMIALVAQLSHNPKNKAKLLKHLVEVIKTAKPKQ